MATHGLPSRLLAHLLTPWPDTGALPPAEALLLDAMRGWNEARTPLPAAALILAAEGAEALALPLDALLRLARPTLHCPLCPRSSADESAMLAVIALAQHEHRSCALAVLLRVAPPLPAYNAMGAVLTMAGGMRAMGLGLANPFSRPR
jgi:hypothetical protein